MISQTTLHVVRGLAVLAGLPEGEYRGSSAVAREIGAREHYLGRLFQALTREGLVISQKGLGGGVRLAKPPQEISLYDVVEPIESVSRFEGCLLGSAQCNNESACVVHLRWARVREAYLDLLKNTTLADLVGDRSGKSRAQGGDASTAAKEL